MAKTLVAGPWIGEFGWEVAIWAPRVRRRSRNFETTTVVCEPGHEALYEDFATRIRTFEGDPKWRRDCQYAYRGSKRVNASRLISPGICTRWLSPYDVKPKWSGGLPPHWEAEDAEFRQLGDPPPAENHISTICVHARCLSRCGDRNWPLEKWNTLIGKIQGYADQIIAVGSVTGAERPSGTVDRRGISVGQLATVLRGSCAIVGPSSGPLAMALQCGTPVVWWSANAKDIVRFSKYWNPFQTQTQQVDDSWDPTPDQVEKEIRVLLKTDIMHDEPDKWGAPGAVNR